MIAKLLLIFMTGVFIPPQDTTNFTLPVDSSDIHARTVDSQTLDSLTSDEVFSYNEVAPNPETLWSRIQRWLIQTIGYIMDNRWVSVAIRFIFFLIFAIVFVGLINQILGGNLSSAFSKKSGAESLSLNIKASELQKTDYDVLLNKALSNQNFRDAVRILYLKALQQLDQSGLITWKPDKTNYDYVKELNAHPVHSSFKKLTYFYEYVEYGHFSIDESGFNNVERIFREFSEKTSG
ncbi:DUF4129 domain-containing protein [Gracilimonas sp.]|uniref:DUF4129 domain-containing protein n=1 Tax=Gracilimonas sp. TaxID=1974203 RepID=UPI0028728845|nr:hypothetical protein [Gracilimonas sp.]